MSWKWLPNAICVVRVLLVAPIVLTLLEQNFVAALVLIVLAGFSDALDGFLARTFDWRTPLGSLLDPAADKLLIVSAFLTLSYEGLVPVALTLVVVIRDVVIVGGAALYQWLIAPVRGEPTIISKLNTACQLLFVLCTLTAEAMAWPPTPVLTVLGAAVFFTSVTSGLNYVVGWSKRAWGSSGATA
ncbi:MAG TPA: CDP-alcohol phosphatidyltransferase family protein [Gammaproteobacteria bacterium]|nr:CDP-alcohol phosphatidyltransferase family protein [Gammaproteobacteria bacterium]